MSSTAALRGVLGALTALALGGCSLLDDVRRSPTEPVSSTPAAPSAAPTPTIDFAVRTARVPVPEGYARSTVEFADAEHGAALYTRCVDGECAATVLVTADGGASWQVRRHPRPKAENHQMYVGRDGTIVLLAEPASWYVSRDEGGTFAATPGNLRPPIAYRTLDGPYGICCEGHRGTKLVRWTGVRAVEVPTKPPVPGTLSAVAYRPGRDLWIASISAGRPYTAVSRDEGSTWLSLPVSGPDEQVAMVQMLVSADGGDVWLLAVATDSRDFSTAWQLAGGGWGRVPADGPPDGQLSAAALGGGVLAVTGPAGSGLLRAGAPYAPTGWPGGTFRLLRDGTLQLTVASGIGIWLGEGAGADRSWTQLVLQP
jgi:hypothetical protein